VVAACYRPPLVLIRLGHSPDPDDAFMFWGLATGKVETDGFEFEHVLKDIQTLNEWALEGKLEVTAVSLHTYPFVQDLYVLLPHGASMGSGYGPVVVARRPLSRTELLQTEIAVPGRMTTAFLTLRLYLGREFPYREVPFDRILDEVETGRAAAGLLIHEGQLTYERHGLAKAVDLGEWWLLETGLPLPLGINVVRRDLGSDNLRAISQILHDSIEAGLEARDEALAYALQFGRGLDPSLADRFVGMYVNELTQDYGEEGRQAVTELLRRGEEIGAFPGPVRVEFVS
jgi:1,4-dihydroxy-6-naphthoate synthase